jgi:hypothetical protein
MVELRFLTIPAEAIVAENPQVAILLKSQDFPVHSEPRLDLDREEKAAWDDRGLPVENRQGYSGSHHN